MRSEDQLPARAGIVTLGLAQQLSAAGLAFIVFDLALGKRAYEIRFERSVWLDTDRRVEQDPAVDARCAGCHWCPRGRGFARILLRQPDKWGDMSPIRHQPPAHAASSSNRAPRSPSSGHRAGRNVCARY
jgi:hypothetical protein